MSCTVQQYKGQMSPEQIGYHYTIIIIITARHMFDCKS